MRKENRIICMASEQKENQRKEEKRMKKNMKRMIGWIFIAVLICCIGFTTKGVTADAAIVSGGKKNYSYSELQKDLQQLKKKYKNHCQVNVIGKSEDKRNLYEVVIGNPDAKKHLLVMGNSFV